MRSGWLHSVWRLEEAQFVGVVADQNILGLLIVIQHHLVVLAAFRLADRFTVALCLGGCQKFQIFVNPVGTFQQDIGALGGRSFTSFMLRGF